MNYFQNGAHFGESGTKSLVRHFGVELVIEVFVLNLLGISYNKLLFLQKKLYFIFIKKCLILSDIEYKIRIISRM